MASKKAARKRELIEPTPGDKRYVRRDKGGKFKDVVDVGKSLAADRRSKSKTVVKPGQGDKGDVKRSPSKKASTKTASSSKKSTARKATTTKATATKSTAKKSSSKKTTSKKK
jgi:hypothetical protein